MRVFLGLIFFMGLDQRGDYELYWSTDPLLELKKFRELMARDRFELILQFLHLNNNADDVPRDHPYHDLLFKICPISEMFIANWQQF